MQISRFWLVILLKFERIWNCIFGSLFDSCGPQDLVFLATFPYIFSMDNQSSGKMSILFACFVIIESVGGGKRIFGHSSQEIFGNECQPLLLFF